MRVVIRVERREREHAPDVGVPRLLLERALSAGTALSYCSALKYATPSEYWTCGNAGSSAAASSNSSAARAKRCACACMMPRFR